MPTTPTPATILAARIARANVPKARVDNLRLATWNIREFGKSPRLAASLVILAKVIGIFDLVSIVELRDDLSDLRQVLQHLGARWKVVFSDYQSDPHGNRERVAFLYRQDRVRFTGLASNAEFSQRTGNGKNADKVEVPWWRPPFLASFEVRGFQFLLVAAHVRWGKSAKAREEEVHAVGAWLADRRREVTFGGQHVLLVGDFNVASDTSKVWPALEASGLVQAPGLSGDPGSDLARGKRYDRILCTLEDVDRVSGKAGTVDIFDGDFEAILPGTGLLAVRLTFEISDHLPLWVEVAV